MEETKRKLAMKFMGSIRGKFIISQALTVAMEAMAKEKYPELSNIGRDNLYPIYSAVKASGDLKEIACNS